MKHKILIPLIALFAATSIIGTTYSAFVFNNNIAVENAVTLNLLAWEFIPADLQPGDIIIINNGTVTVNGEEVESEIDYGDGDSAYSGDSGATTHLEIHVNDDGSLSITTYDLQPNAALFGTNDGTAYFPQYVNINGEQVQITSIAEPVNFESTRVLFVDSQVNNIVIPEGYTSICNRAFYNCSLANPTTFSFPLTITTIGSQIINVPRNNT